MGKVKIVIDKNGKSVVEAEGFLGQSCTDATKIFSDIGKKVDEQLKPEFFQEQISEGWLTTNE